MCNLAQKAWSPFGIRRKTAQWGGQQNSRGSSKAQMAESSQEPRGKGEGSRALRKQQPREETKATSEKKVLEVSRDAANAVGKKIFNLVAYWDGELSDLSQTWKELSLGVKGLVIWHSPLFWVVFIFWLTLMEKRDIYCCWEIQRSNSVLFYSGSPSGRSNRVRASWRGGLLHPEEG